MNSKLHYQLADLFENVADHAPERTALVYGDRRLTFAQVDERATRLAHHLQSRGVGPGARVGLYLYNCNEYIEGALAAFKLRASPVNINFRYVEDELRYLLDDSEAAAIVYHRSLAARVAGAVAGMGKMPAAIVVEDEAVAAAPAPSAVGGRHENDRWGEDPAAATPPPRAESPLHGVTPPPGAVGGAPTTDPPPPGAASSAPTPTSAAAAVAGELEYEEALGNSSPIRDFAERSGDDIYLIYTGGTTGMPKGVMWRHEDVFFAGLQGGNPGLPDITAPEQLGTNAAARENAPATLPVAPLMHGNGHWAAMIGMHGGGKVVLATSRRLDPHEIWSLVERERVQVISIVGDAMARPLADALYEARASEQAKEEGGARREEHSRTAYDLSSLLVLTSAGALFSEDVKERLRAKLGTTLLIDAFGMSEAGHQGMNLGKNADGKLHFSVDGFTAVLDDELRRVQPGSATVGMLGRCGRLPQGYWKDPEKTARTFVTDPDGVRWVVAGDMATVEPDGTVIVLGRGTFCINSGGEKIYPEEVEQALKSHPAVYDAVVVGVPDERWGERVAAVVQPRAGATFTLEDMGAHARTKVAGYKVPRELHVVDEIVRSPSGKADYKWAKAVAVGDVE